MYLSIGNVNLKHLDRPVVYNLMYGGEIGQNKHIVTAVSIIYKGESWVIQKGFL